MPCTPFRFGDGGFGIVCTRSRKRVHKCSVDGCMRDSGFQCDHREPGKKKTCDRHLCEVHANQVGPDLHFCPAHQQESSSNKLTQKDLFE